MTVLSVVPPDGEPETIFGSNGSTYAVGSSFGRDPNLLTMVAMEALYATSAGGLYLSGVSDHLTRLLSTPIRQRSHRAKNPHALPVVLLHGLAHNQSWAVKIQREMQSCGLKTRALNYYTFGRSVDQCAEQAAEKIVEYIERERVPGVHVAAHSLGGIVLRAALNKYPELQPLVATGITIGSPHHGTPWATTGFRVIPKVGGLVEELRPGSETLSDIDEQTTEQPTRWMSIYSTTDEVVPGDNGRLDHPKLRATQFVLRGVGHYGLTYDATAVRVVTDAVLESDALVAGRSTGIRVA